jgi:hypothetical protein
MARTLGELAAEALLMQDACNLSGLVAGWHRVVMELREHLPTAGTCEINTHPINQLWASKLHDLAGMGASDPAAFALAYEACRALAQAQGR